MRAGSTIGAAPRQAAWSTPGLTAPSHSFECLARSGSKRVLLVEPDEARRARLRDAVRGAAEVDVDADFLAARKNIFSKPYDWLVANIRLGAYNGLHLVHLAGSSGRSMRFLVYADRCDLWLAREAQRFGAFYESGDRVDRALPVYLDGALPPQDRRILALPDVIAAFRGGRRCTDPTSATSSA